MYVIGKRGERKKAKIIALCRIQCLEVGGGDKTADGVFRVDESCGGNKTRKRHWGRSCNFYCGGQGNANTY